MPSTRRSAIVAVVALAAGVALAACGDAQPGTAAYVAGKRYTERQVDEMVDELRNSALSQSPRLRNTAVSFLVLADLAKRATAERSITVPAPDYAGVARSVGAPADSALVKAVAEIDAAGNALTTGMQPVQPTDDDLRDIYEFVRQDPEFPPGATFEQVADQLRQNPGLPTVLGVRNALVEQAEKHDVVVNPRYLPLVANIGAGVPVVMAEGSGVVADLAS